MDVFVWYGVGCDWRWFWFVGWEFNLFWIVWLVGDGVCLIGMVNEIVGLWNCV